MSGNEWATRASQRKGQSRNIEERREDATQNPVTVGARRNLPSQSLHTTVNANFAFVLPGRHDVS